MLRHKHILAFLLFVLVPLSFFQGFWLHLRLKVEDNNPRDIAVLYTFKDINPESLGNLKFFIREAIEDDLKCEYMIIVQGHNSKPKELPALPSHANYFFHEEECFGLGNHGWLVNKLPNKKKYKYFIFLSSTARGPFIPHYAKGRVHWTEPYTKLLRTNGIKLVGPAISCNSVSLFHDQDEFRRDNPHVLSYAMATDQVGLGIMLSTKQVFKCHATRRGAVFYGEVGASLAILNAGHNIGSFLAKYTGIDWRRREFWVCNQKVSPMENFMYGGTTLLPLELQFVPYPHLYTTQATHARLGEAATLVEKYELWASENPRDSPRNSFWKSESDFKVRKVLLAKALGPNCLDWEHYVRENAEVDPTPEAAWDHFVHAGQFQGNPFRFLETCSILTTMARAIPYLLPP